MLSRQFISARGHGSVPSTARAGLLRVGSIAEFKALAPLPKNTQELIDTAIVRIGRQRLVIVEDLIAEGLTFPLPNWLSVPTITHHEAAEAGHAQRTMVPKARGERQIMDLDTFTVPVYATWDDFSFNIRELEAADRVGYPLDTTHVEQAVRNVNFAVEDAAINGGPTIGGNSVSGMLDTTNTFTYAGGEAWDVVGHTGEEILQDVIGGMKVLRADKFYGPYNLYVPTTYGEKLNEDFKANSDKTILQRLEELRAGGRNLRVREADLLPANRTLLVQMTSDVVDVVVGQTPTDLSWSPEPGFERFFLILACVVMRLKVNHDGNHSVAAGNLT